MTAAQRTTADAMIEAKGQTVTLTRRTSGAYDPATGSATIVDTVQTGKGVILDFATGLRKMAGSNIAAADRQCLLSALNSAGAALTRPAVDDTLTDAAGNAFTITEVSELSPAGTDILYTLTVKAAV